MRFGLTVAAAFAAATLVVAAPAPASATIVADGGHHQILNRSWALCLTVVDGAAYEDAPVGARDCVNGESQRWLRTASGQLQVKHTMMCLGVQWVGNGYWSQVVQRPCASAPVWTIVDRDDGWSELRITPPPAPNRPTEMCVDKYWWNAIMWDCHGPSWQQWQTLG